MKSKQELKVIQKVWKSKEKSHTIEGMRLAYNIGYQRLYVKQLKSLVDRMTRETNKKILFLFNSSTAKEFMAMDESLASQARILMNALTNKFNFLFTDKSKPLSEKMVKDQAKYSKQILAQSLKKLSNSVTINANLITTTPKLKEIAKASIAENISLIKSIPQEYMQKVRGSVMRAINSGGDLKILNQSLKKYDVMTERRAKNIAEDQTRKAYNSINSVRMQSVGIKKFKWLHSGGGQHPRAAHMAMNGEIFSFDDLPVIDEHTGERGIPGQAINCRCTMNPVIEFSEN
jgi:SPP1 gp7 family putative phage head morphogenesis protein